MTLHHPPAGARDLLPLEVAQKACINDQLQQIFQRWGYQRIVTSTLEWLDTLVAGGAIAPSTVIQLQDSGEGRLGLRPELTASIARAVVTRMTDSHPQRLCYRANVFRNPPEGYHGRQMEFFQAGVELLFAGGVRADAEILLLFADCLNQLGVENWQVVLGDAGLTQSLLAKLPQDLQHPVRDCITRLDWVELSQLPYPDPTVKSLALQLFNLRGDVTTVLEQLAQLNLEGESLARVDRLKSLLSLVQESNGGPLPLVLDLSWLQSFDYYTGMVFQAVSRQAEQCYVLGQGGRYDQLLSQYHPQKHAFPGTGFSFNIEDLHQCLLGSDRLPTETAVIDYLICPVDAPAEGAAFRYAQQLRLHNPDRRVELDLGGRTPAELIAYGEQMGIGEIVWINAEGQIT
ncbi:MAG: ATP phosphoribosyltransferase regulatory subunit [Synechocystis sp.]|nr:ATP phosphoribosyltransferase regulatory subunit [Synechocystis sp.]